MKTTFKTLLMALILQTTTLMASSSGFENRFIDPDDESTETTAPYSVMEITDTSQEEELSCDTHAVIYQSWDSTNGLSSPIGFANFGVTDALQNACSEDNWKYTSSTLPNTFYMGFPPQLPSIGGLTHTSAHSSGDFEAKTATPDTLSDYTTAQVYRISRKNLSNEFNTVMYASTDLGTYWAEHGASFLSFVATTTMSVTTLTVLKFEKVDTMSGGSPTTDGDTDVVPQE